MRHRIVAGTARHLHGWRRDRPTGLDGADLPFTQGILRNLPASASLRSKWAPIRDQMSIGSCVANATLECAGYLYTRTGRPDPFLSRLYLYYWTRAMEGVPGEEDSGCQIRDAVRTLAKRGSCLETTWSYLDDGKQFAMKPPPEADAEALEHQAVVYYRCTSLRAVKASLAQGYPVVGGFTVFESMLSDKVADTGDVPFPAEDTDVGGHAVAFVGYHDDEATLTFANSWGTSWGDGGFGTLPMRFFAEGLLTDCWTFRRVEQP